MVLLLRDFIFTIMEKLRLSFYSVGRGKFEESFEIQHRVESCGCSVISLHCCGLLWTPVLQDGLTQPHRWIYRPTDVTVTAVTIQRHTREGGREPSEILGNQKASHSLYHNITREIKSNSDFDTQHGVVCLLFTILNRLPWVIFKKLIRSSCREETALLLDWKRNVRIEGLIQSGLLWSKNIDW